MKWMAVMAAAVGLVAGNANADEISKVESRVYEASGGPADIARRASSCIARLVKPGFTTAPTIVSSDIEAGQIVANSAFTFTERFIFVFDYTGRAKLLFEARPDRFRITFSEVEHFVDGYGWRPISRPKKHDPNGAESMMLAIADEVAECVTAPTADW